MEIREFAEMIFQGKTLEEKCFHPDGGVLALTDHKAGSAVMWREPGRASEIEIFKGKNRRHLPRPSVMHDEKMRIRCLHAFANHELMALEMMAWALLAFPDAPRAFRVGLLRVLEDEQRHFQMYADRIAALGTNFGELPVNDHFWRLAPTISSPLEWVCTMHLSLEQSNLDHATVYKDIFKGVGDDAAASLMQQILEDEMMHVRFGVNWLNKYKDPSQSSFQVFVDSLAVNHPVHRARSPHYFNVEARRKAGLDDEFIASMKACVHGHYPPRSDGREMPPSLQKQQKGRTT